MLRYILFYVMLATAVNADAEYFNPFLEKDLRLFGVGFEAKWVF